MITLILCTCTYSVAVNASNIIRTINVIAILHYQCGLYIYLYTKYVYIHVHAVVNCACANVLAFFNLAVNHNVCYYSRVYIHMDKPKDHVVKEGQLDVEYDLCWDLDVII